MAGKYIPLEQHLKTLPNETMDVTMSFEQIERIINDKLPASAYKYQAWWSYEKTPHQPEKQAIANADWKVQILSICKRSGCDLEGNKMRKISGNFLSCLKSGFLSSITDKVKTDQDLDLEIREDYVNVYYKGNSLLNLTETGSSRYKVEIDKKFREGLDLPVELDESTVSSFVRRCSTHQRKNIVKHGKRSLELEYEQLIIRANNFEPRNNTEYFIVDRQYVAKEGRFDLSGIYWKREGRRKGQKVPVCLMGN